MKALLEIDGPSHRIITATALVALLIPGEHDDLTVTKALDEFRNFAEWFADMVNEELAAPSYGIGDLREALTGCEYLHVRLAEAIKKLEDAQIAALERHSQERRAEWRQDIEEVRARREQRRAAAAAKDES